MGHFGRNQRRCVAGTKITTGLAHPRNCSWYLNRNRICYMIYIYIAYSYCSSNINQMEGTCTRRFIHSMISRRMCLK